MTPKKPENPFLSLIINILLPVVILNKGTPHLGPQPALLLALAFPLGYGLQDYIRNRHKNYVSLLGVINIVLTGGLALLHLQGKWFAVKEALLPASLGVLVFFSARTKQPAAQMLFCNPQVLNMNEIDAAIDARNNRLAFRTLIQKTTFWLSLSFFISALLNFVLGLKIFTEIDPSLLATQQAEILNQQIAKMTWAGMLVIALPLMAFSAVLITWFLKKMTALTGLSMNELLKSH